MVRVGDELLEADRIFINVGGRAVVPDMPGVGEAPFFTNSSLLETDVLPEHLVVVGGSYIGLEFAQIYARFGARVTVIEKGPRLIGREDAEVSDAVRSILEAEGIAVRTGAECIHFAHHPNGVAVGLDCSEGEPKTVGSHLLLAVGRRPNTDDLGLEKTGIETDERGYIQVNDRLETSVPGIWALGDCNGRGAFTHTAYNDFEIVAENLLDGADRKVSDRIPCYALYVDPPLGRVGMTEAEARATARRILVGRRPMTQVGRAVEKDEPLGFMKIVVDADTDAILGRRSWARAATRRSIPCSTSWRPAATPPRCGERCISTRPCPSWCRPSPASFGSFLRSARLRGAGTHCVPRSP